MSNAFQFGARGDGVADDTAALQHALTAGDGVLALHKGTFRISRPLVLDLAKNGYAAVRGDGGTSRLIMAGPGPALQILGDHRGTAVPASVRPHTWEKERFPTITGLEILGEHPEAVGIELRKTIQATISQVLVRGCRHGIHLVERNRNFLLTGAHLYDNAEFGLFFDRCDLHQTIVCGNHISYNKLAGIKSLGGDVHNLHITGNDIEYNNQPGAPTPENVPRDSVEPGAAEIWFDASEGTISEVTIASNTIQATIEPAGANIRIHGPARTPPLGAVLIAVTGNVIGSQTRGIEIRHAQRVTITGNTIYDSADLSLLLAHCSGVAAAGNTFVWRGDDTQPPQDGMRLEDCDNCSLTGLVAERLCSGTPERGAGITLVRCRDSAVSDCQILDSLVRGIELEDCRRCRISNNSIVDRREVPLMRNAIRITGQSRQNLVQGNLLGSATERLIDVAEGSAAVEGNLELE